MKIVSLLLVLSILLCGCTGIENASDYALALRSRICNAASCSFDAGITADYGEQIYTFAMGCQTDAHGNLYFSVEAPESISGITGKISMEGGALTFDDQLLAFSLLADGRLSPVSAPWLMMRALRGGYIAAADENRLTLHDSYEEDAFVVDIYLDASGLPQSVDIYWEGCRIIAMQIKSFVIS